MSEHPLFQHIRYIHRPQNVNALHKQHIADGGFNLRLAVALTTIVGSMPTAYTFAVLACVGLLAILGVLSPLVALLVAWLSQTLIQLVLLPVIMVGQNVLSKKAELQADEQYNTTIKTYHDIEQIMAHLAAQDAELLKHTVLLVQMAEQNGKGQ